MASVKGPACLEGHPRPGDGCRAVGRGKTIRGSSRGRRRGLRFAGQGAVTALATEVSATSREVVGDTGAVTAAPPVRASAKRGLRGRPREPMGAAGRSDVKRASMIPEQEVLKAVTRPPYAVVWRRGCSRTQKFHIPIKKSPLPSAKGSGLVAKVYRAAGRRGIRPPASSSRRRRFSTTRRRS